MAGRCAAQNRLPTQPMPCTLSPPAARTWRGRRRRDARQQDAHSLNHGQQHAAKHGALARALQPSAQLQEAACEVARGRERREERGGTRGRRRASNGAGAGQSVPRVATDTTAPSLSCRFAPFHLESPRAQKTHRSVHQRQWSSRGPPSCAAPPACSQRWRTVHPTPQSCRRCEAPLAGWPAAVRAGVQLWAECMGAAGRVPARLATGDSRLSQRIAGRQQACVLPVSKRPHSTQLCQPFRAGLPNSHRCRRSCGARWGCSSCP